jgi:fluoride exporter
VAVKFDEDGVTRLNESVMVAAGGALGTLLRFLMNGWLHHPTVPISTAIENVAGAFLLGCLAGYLAGKKDASSWLRSGVGVGFCGGFTTMSTFAADTIFVLLRGDLIVLGLYVSASLIGGILAAGLGIRVGERFVGGRKGAR